MTAYVGLYLVVAFVVAGTSLALAGNCTADAEHLEYKYGRWGDPVHREWAETLRGDAARLTLIAIASPAWPILALLAIGRVITLTGRADRERGVK